MNSKKKALVLGITGGIGSEVARRLQQSGWEVVALHRDPKRVPNQQAAQVWHKGDAMNRADVLAAAKGVDVIVHGVNPPAYRDWEKLVVPMMENSIAAAAENGARIVLPGTLYNFGNQPAPLLAEDAPQVPGTAKGKVRIELERRLQTAVQAGTGVKALIVCCGDFFGPNTQNSWFAQGLVNKGKPVRRVVYPGRAGCGHQWNYLPDVADTIVKLLERDTKLGGPADGNSAAQPGGALEDFARFHLAGHWDPDGKQMAAAIARAAGKPDLAPARFPWPLIALMAPFNQTFAGLWEMRYLWQREVRLDNRKLVQFLGKEPTTPLDVAVATSLRGLGCLGEAKTGLQLAARG